MMESLEGKKGQPRYKPPFPANYGLFGRPTTINNTEPMPRCRRSSATAPSGSSISASRTTAVRKSSRCPATSTIRAISKYGLGTSFADLLQLAGGVRGGRKLKGVIPGGSSMPVLAGRHMMACTMDYDSIQKAGSGLGSGAVIVMDETTCMVRACQRIARFYYAGSCGQCTPCREGHGLDVPRAHPDCRWQGRRWTTCRC
jgi:NADH-quinone oxidoreductase subunit F